MGGRPGKFPRPGNFREIPEFLGVHGGCFRDKLMFLLRVFDVYSGVQSDVFRRFFGTQFPTFSGIFRKFPEISRKLSRRTVRAVRAVRGVAGGVLGGGFKL